MNNIKRLFFIKFFIFTMIFASTASAIELDWLHDYDQALAQAKQEKKDIYLFIGADKCRFCKMFKENTLSNKDLMQKLREEYILVYLSRDQHKIPNWFETKGVPRHYFLDEKGNIFHDTWGGRELKGFYDVLDEAELKKEWSDK